MDTTTSSQEVATPDSPGRKHQVPQPQQPPSVATCAAGSSPEASLSQMIIRVDASLAEVRMAQAATQLEVLRAVERLDLMEHAALRDRLDDLDARLHRERRRRETGEAALQKAVTSILRSLNRTDFGDSLDLLNELRSGDIAASPPRSRSGQDGGLLVSHGLLSSGPSECSATGTVATAAPGRHSASSGELRAGSLPLRGSWEERLSLGAGQEIATTATQPEASAVGAASSAREAYWPPTAALAGASSQPGAVAAALPLAREAYEELFAKKARCFEQAVNMIEATAASVTKRLEVVLAESSAAMRQEASDRAAAMSEIQRALQELRDTPDRPQREQSIGQQAPHTGGSSGHQNATGRQQGSSANAPSTAPQQVQAEFNRRSLVTTAASPNVAPGSGTGGGGKGAAVGGGPNKAKEEGALTAPVQSPLPVSAAPEQRQTIARCGSESSALMGLTAPHKALPVSSPVSASAAGSPPSSSAGGGGTSMVGPGVVRASSQPQHVQFDVGGGPAEAIIMSAKDADLSPIAEQQGSHASPRKHVVLAPKTLTASNLGGSALFRQQAESASIGRLTTKPVSTMPAQSSDAGQSSQQPNVQQTGLIAATPRPSAAQPAGVQAYGSVNGAVKSGMTQPHSSQVHPQQTPSRAVGPPVGWVSQQQAAAAGARPGDATPVMRPGSVPPGTRMPGRSVTTAAAVMRFTSK